MRVVFLDPLEERLRDFPARYLPSPQFDVSFSMGEGKPPTDVEKAEAVIWWRTPIDRSFIEGMPRLRFLQRVGWFRSRGDATAALERGIPVAVTPFGVADRVAQHTLTLTLSLIRQVPASYQAVLDGINPDRLPEEEAGGPARALNWARIPNIGSLNDKTVGIIGFGEIGSCFARLLAPFNCRVLYFKRRRLTPQQESFYGVEYAPMDDLIPAADLLTTFVPPSPETRDMLGEREFGLMKPRAYFVNCGRGVTIDEDALIQVLRQGHIAGAALDVFTVEPLPTESPLRGLKNVLLTPHSAGGIGGWVDTFERLAENLRRVEAGLPVILPMGRDDPQPG